MLRFKTLFPYLLIASVAIAGRSCMIVSSLTQDEIGSILTPRWFPIPQHVLDHPVQTKLKQSQSQFKVIAAGRRSYKTERFLKRKFVRHAITVPNQRLMLGAPVRPQAKMIFWDDVKLLTPKWAIKDINETELRIDYINGSQLYTVGLKEYQRVEGVLWHKVGITEYQHVSPKFFTQTLQPILNDTGGEGTLEGRPLGKNHFYDDFLRERTDPSRWQSFTWRSSDVLTAQQITDAKNDLAKEDYEREYDASFDTEGTRVYYAYGEENKRKWTYDHDLPLIVTCDFNATEKPMSWTVGQRAGLMTFWMKSLSFRYTNTLVMCEKLSDYVAGLGKKPAKMIFYGDYAGKKQTSNSSYSDWDIITNFFNKTHEVETRLKPCKSVRDRNAATNAQLCNANGVRRMFVDPDECKPLIKDWEYVQRAENGVDLDDKDPSLTHNSDSVDYYCDYEFPIRDRSTVVTN